MSVMFFGVGKGHGFEVPGTWADTISCYLKPSKYPGVCSKYEHIKVENDTMAVTDVELVGCLPKAFFSGV